MKANLFFSNSSGVVADSLPVPADMSSAGNEYQDLDKLGCARQFESELSLHSLALFLQSAKNSLS